MTRAADIIRNIAVVTLMILFVLPSAGHMLTADKKTSAVENRALQTGPVWAGDLKDFREKIDGYLNDQFGFRSYAIRAENRLQLAFKKENSRVVVGQDDWLFLSTSVIWNSYEGKGYTPETKDLWLDSLAELKSATEQNGAEFYAFIPPNKARIYPEYAPIRYGAPGDRFVSDLLADRRAKDLNLLKVTPAILAKKETGPVYYRTDTHWTLLGGYQAYETLLTRLNADGHELPMLREADLSIKTTADREGDLYKLLGDSDFKLETLTTYSAPPARGFLPRKSVQKDAIPANLQTKIFTKESPETTLVIIGDSFSESLVPLLKHSFDKIVIVHHRQGEFTAKDVLEYNPDFVLFAPVERFGEKLTIFPAAPSSP